MLIHNEGTKMDLNPLIGHLDPKSLIEQYQGDARLFPQTIVTLAREVLALRDLVQTLQGDDPDGNPLIDRYLDDTPIPEYKLVE